MKNPLVIAVVAGASLIAIAILIGALLLRSPATPPSQRVDPIIAAIAASPSTRDKEVEQKRQAMIFVSMLGTCLKEYELEVGELPSDLRSLHELPSDLTDKSLWVAKMNKPVSPDPWGNAYNYVREGKTFRVWSNGPDCKSGTIDDIEPSK